MPHASLTDFHAHFVTEEYVKRTVAAGMDKPDGMPSWPSWDLPA
jgi:6-methylsalicylate decarboxylase